MDERLGCAAGRMVTDPEFKCSRVILPSDEDNVSLDYGLLRAIYDSPYPERIFRVSTAMTCWPAYLAICCQTHPHDCCHRHQQTQIEKNRASTVDANFEKMCARFGWTEFGVCGFTSNVCIAAVRGRCVQQISVSIAPSCCMLSRLSLYVRGRKLPDMQRHLR